MTEATPNLPITYSAPAKQVKSASPEYILFDESTVPIEVMTDLVFQDIGGQELISMARQNTVRGQDVIYQPIKNLAELDQEYSPTKILSLQRASTKYFDKFAININDKLPDGQNVYIEAATGDLIIEVINMEADERLQVQISTSGTIYKDED